MGACLSKDRLGPDSLPCPRAGGLPPRRDNRGTSSVEGRDQRDIFRGEGEPLAANSLRREPPVQPEFDPRSFTMADQNIVFGAAADMAMQVQVLNPWAIQRNKVS
ncbi:MAG TPA: hypothetical protein VM529_22975 [Gemmata sp.]|nr:hypothetical protein [Gemmata sp.]